MWNSIGASKMFKKLKDKIAEEVKSSPSRIQQLAQVAQVMWPENSQIADFLQWVAVDKEIVEKTFIVQSQ